MTYDYLPRRTNRIPLISLSSGRRPRALPLSMHCFLAGEVFGKGMERQGEGFYSGMGTTKSQGAKPCKTWLYSRPELSDAGALQGATRKAFLDTITIYGDNDP